MAETVETVTMTRELWKRTADALNTLRFGLADALCVDTGNDDQLLSLVTDLQVCFNEQNQALGAMIERLALTERALSALRTNLSAALGLGDGARDEEIVAAVRRAITERDLYKEIVESDEAWEGIGDSEALERNLRAQKALDAFRAKGGGG